jgi:hypothetical protein
MVASSLEKILVNRAQFFQHRVVSIAIILISFAKDRGFNYNNFVRFVTITVASYFCQYLKRLSARG